MGYHHAAPKRQTGRRLAEAPQSHEPEWVKSARWLRRYQRWSYQHIADHLRETGALAPQLADGAAYRRVYKALNRERVRQTDKTHRVNHKEQIAAADKARVNAKAPRCSVCGAKLYRPPKVPPPVCLTCRRQAGARNQAAIAGLAIAGWSAREIAEHLGLPARTVSSTITVLRHEGMPIPYRSERKPR